MITRRVFLQVLAALLPGLRGRLLFWAGHEAGEKRGTVFPLTFGG